MAPLPDIGMSSVQKFVEDHTQLQRDLMLSRDENASLKQLYAETLHKTEFLEAELRAARQEIRDERTRANTWLGYVMSLSGRLAAIRATVSSAETLAAEAARAAAARGLAAIEDDAGNDGKELERVVNQMHARTDLPPNALGAAKDGPLPAALT